MEELFRPIAEEEDDAGSLDLTLRLSVGGGVEKKSSRPRAELPSTEDRSSLARMMLLSRARDRAAKELEEASSGGARRLGASLKEGGGGIALHGGASIPNSNPRHNRIGQHQSLPIMYPYHRVYYVPVPNGIQLPYVMAPTVSTTAGGAHRNMLQPVAAQSDSTASSSSSLSNDQSGSVRGGGSTSSGDSRKQTIPEKAEQSTANKLVPTDDAQPGVKSNTKSPERQAKTSASRTNGPPLARRMPLVSATGDGANGKTITGFLHSYTNSEVRILCVCHGISLTPAEFVGHAGATDVSQPLKQIVVVGDSS